MKKFLFIGLAALVALSGCNLFNRDFYRTADDFPENGKGMLVLILDGSDIATHTIAPDVSMDIGSYVVSGDHRTLSDTFTSTVNDSGQPGEVYSNNDLAPGTWDIEVAAWNGSDGTGTQIGYGFNSVTILPNSTELVTVNVGPEIEVPGSPGTYYTGSLTLALIWDLNAVPDPVVVASLIKGTPETTTVTLDSYFNYTNDDTTVTLSRSGLTVGYYTLNIMLYNESVAPANKIMGDTESVRIVNGLTTSGTWDLSGTPGEGEVTITPDLNNPIGISLNIAKLMLTGAVTATLQSPPSGSWFTYDWYEDGDLKKPLTPWAVPVAATTDTYTSGTAFEPGTNYRLSVVVNEYAEEDIASDVITISSITFSFTPMEITLTVPPDLTASRNVVAALPAGTTGFFTYDWYVDGGEAQMWNSSTATTSINDTHTLSAFSPGSNHNVSVVVTEYDASELATANVITISSETQPFTEPNI